MQSTHPRHCRVALLGCGTVGSAVARRLTAPDGDPALLLTHIFDRHAAEKRERANRADRGSVRLQADVGGPAEAGLCGPSPAVWTDRIDDVLAADVDVVVEALGGVDPAGDWIRSALLAGKSVVTSNKQVMARQGASLLALAARQGRQLRFEAAVGGAMPIVRAVAGGLAGDRIERIAAILNGTSNAVLSQVDARGIGLDDALAEAQRRGFAERDASADLDGSDARAKLAILCALAFGVRVSPDDIRAESCATLAPEAFADARGRGRTIRQIAWAAFDRRDRALTAWVGPASVPRGSLFGRTTGPLNAAIVTGAFAGTIQLSGPGAGGDATSVAILSDILAIARDRAAIVPAPVLARPAVIRVANGIVDDDVEWLGARAERGLRAGRAVPEEVA